MASKNFSGCKLKGVIVTEEIIGHGSYATVFKLDYLGLKCAGKKIHEILQQGKGKSSYPIRRFEEECCLLSKLHHPNIVQFLGVFFQRNEPIPILVMEFLHNNLTSCIDRYGILEDEVSYSILHDVALGMHYLHSQIPPIIHRDLSSNNILLTSSMTAKISDLGVAKILNLNPQHTNRLTQAPGTPTYMPPEVMVANPKYNTSVDVFSFGVVVIHVFSGKWPAPQIGPNRADPMSDRLIPVSEAERREVFLRKIGNDHPVMDLILKCISNIPQFRVKSKDIIKQTADMLSQVPNESLFSNNVEMLARIKNEEVERALMIEKHITEIQQLQYTHSEQLQNIQENMTQQKVKELKGLTDQNKVLSTKISLLYKQLKVMNSTIQNALGIVTGSGIKYDLNVESDPSEEDYTGTYDNVNINNCGINQDGTRNVTDTLIPLSKKFS